MKTNTIHTGDCTDVLPDVPANSVHAVVTDPPYGLAFMGKSWDDFEPKEYQEWCEQWASKAMRVLKPGGHMLAFSGNRTHHRLFSGVEDAGYEIRDTITWHYGSGFPKALDVSKAIDKQKDAEREVVGEYEWYDEANRDTAKHETPGNIDYGDYGDNNDRTVTAPATDAAKKWDGFKTALKPATEYVVVARKELSEGTVAENVQEHGTAALNIDACRVNTMTQNEIDRSGANTKGDVYGNYDSMEWEGEKAQSKGRYPANVIFGEQAAEALDAEVGPKESGDTVTSSDGRMFDTGKDTEYTDTQEGPSRYFYTSKATKSERTLDGKIDNAHPTVKPQDLMEWLVTLVTAEGQIVLDPFIGSGTTGMACKELNRQFIGIEQNERYADIARVRCGLTPEDPSVVREDDTQTGLGSF